MTSEMFPTVFLGEKAVLDLGRRDCFRLPFVAFRCLWLPFGCLDLELNSTGRLVAGNTFFSTAQPGELGIEDSNSLGGGFPGNWPGRGGGKRGQHQSAAGSLVTRVGLAAPGSQPAEFLRGPIKKTYVKTSHPHPF